MSMHAYDVNTGRENSPSDSAGYSGPKRKEQKTRNKSEKKERKKERLGKDVLTRILD